MRFRVLDQQPRLCEASDVVVTARGPAVTIEGTDVDGKAHRLRFVTFQALRVTTIDCFAVPKGLRLDTGLVMEVEDSTWLKELERSLRRVDVTATFLTRAHHYVLNTGDDVIEVVAHDLQHDEPPTRR